MGWLSSRSERTGPRYDPHRPWLVVGYRPGGGRAKSVHFFGSQAEAAHHLRQQLREQREYELDARYVYLIRHVTGGPSQWWVLSDAMPRYEWERLARTQARAASSSRYGMASRRSR